MTAPVPIAPEVLQHAEGFSDKLLPVIQYNNYELLSAYAELAELLGVGSGRQAATNRRKHDSAQGFFGLARTVHELVELLGDFSGYENQSGFDDLKRKTQDLWTS